MSECFCSCIDTFLLYSFWHCWLHLVRFGFSFLFRFLFRVITCLFANVFLCPHLFVRLEYFCFRLCLLLNGKDCSSTFPESQFFLIAFFLSLFRSAHPTATASARSALPSISLELLLTRQKTSLPSSTPTCPA